MKNLTPKLVRNGIRFMENGSVLSRINEAPSDFKLERHNNGFYVENKDLRICYSKITFSGNDSYEVSFKSFWPKISFQGYCPQGFLGKIKFDSCICESVSLTSGDLNLFNFPVAEQTEKDIGNILLFRHYHEFFLANPRNKVNPDWFLLGDEILKIAGKKYNLSKLV